MIIISSHLQTFRTTLIKDNSVTDRMADMEIIEDCRIGDGFKHYYRRAINSEGATTSEDDWRRLYRSMNDMDTVIKKFISFCPDLDIFVPNQPLRIGNVKRAEKQQKLAKRALKTIKWKRGINEVYDTLESKGDVFFYIYFNDDLDKIPKLKYLEPKYMKDIILDENSEPEMYIYKEPIVKQIVNKETGLVTTSYIREVTTLFERGRVTTIDPLYELDKNTNTPVKSRDSNGEYLYDVEETINRASYANEIAIIRIQSFKKFNEKFSRIPASSYIDHCLNLDGLNSNIEQINLMLGYPVTYIIGGSITSGERKPSGFIYVDKDEGSNDKPEIVISQITNELVSLFKQVRAHEDALYDLVGLVNKTAQEKLGNTDSARVVATYEAPKVNKIELYVDNIIDPMELYFRILFKENNLWDEDIDYGVSLHKPTPLLKGSIFDVQLYGQNALSMNSKAKDELALENGDDYETIKNRNVEVAKLQEENQTISKETEATVRSNNN